MNGASDTTMARTQGLAAWGTVPSGGTLSVSMAYFCGNAAGVANTLCGDGTVPKAYVTATATAKLGGDMLSYSKTVVEKVRVQ
jgi:hypothetical protein